MRVFADEREYAAYTIKGYGFVVYKCSLNSDLSFFRKWSTQKRKNRTALAAQVLHLWPDTIIYRLLRLLTVPSSSPVLQ